MHPLGRAIGIAFLFPNRNFSLESFHDPAKGVKGRVPMPAAAPHHDTGFANRHLSQAVDDDESKKLKLIDRRCGQSLQFSLGHRNVRFVGQKRSDALTGGASGNPDEPALCAGIGMPHLGEQTCGVDGPIDNSGNDHGVVHGVSHQSYSGEVVLVLDRNPGNSAIEREYE